MAATWAATGAFASGTGSLSVAWPASGYAAGDYALMVCESAGVTISTPSGWTLIDGYASTSTTVAVYVFSKIAASGSESAVTVADSGNHTTAQIHVFKGVDAGTPVLYTQRLDSGGSATPPQSQFGGYSTGELDGSYPPEGTLAVLCAGLDADSAATNIITGCTASPTYAFSSPTGRGGNLTSSGTGGGVLLATASCVYGEAMTGGSVQVSTSASTAYCSIGILLKSGAHVVAVDPGTLTFPDPILSGPRGYAMDNDYAQVVNMADGGYTYVTMFLQTPYVCAGGVATSMETHGYEFGGIDTDYNGAINKHEFSTNTRSVVSATIDTYEGGGGLTTAATAYLTVGTGLPLYGSYKMPYSSETVSSTSSSIAIQRFYVACSSFSDAGYLMAGYTLSSNTVTGETGAIEKLLFSSETYSTLGATFTAVGGTSCAGAAGAVNSGTKAYIQVEAVDAVWGFTKATDVIAQLSGGSVPSYMGFRNSKFQSSDYGWFFGGDETRRIAFSSDTYISPGVGDAAVSYGALGFSCLTVVGAPLIVIGMAAPTIPVSTRSVSIATAAPTLSIGVVTVTPNAALSTTGKIPSVDVTVAGGDQTRSPSTAVVALSGKQPEVFVDTPIYVLSRSVSVSTYAPTLTADFSATTFYLSHVANNLPNPVGMMGSPGYSIYEYNSDTDYAITPASSGGTATVTVASDNTECFSGSFFGWFTGPLQEASHAFSGFTVRLHMGASVATSNSPQIYVGLLKADGSVYTTGFGNGYGIISLYPTTIATSNTAYDFTQSSSFTMSQGDRLFIIPFFYIVGSGSNITLYYGGTGSYESTITFTSAQPLLIEPVTLKPATRKLRTSGRQRGYGWPSYTNTSLDLYSLDPDTLVKRFVVSRLETKSGSGVASSSAVYISGLSTSYYNTHKLTCSTETIALYNTGISNSTALDTPVFTTPERGFHTAFSAGAPTVEVIREVDFATDAYITYSIVQLATQGTGLGKASASAPDNVRGYLRAVSDVDRVVSEFVYAGRANYALASGLNSTGLGGSALQSTVDGFFGPFNNTDAAERISFSDESLHTMSVMLPTSTYPASAGYSFSDNGYVFSYDSADVNYDEGWSLDYTTYATAKVFQAISGSDALGYARHAVWTEPYAPNPQTLYQADQIRQIAYTRAFIRGAVPTPHIRHVVFPATRDVAVTTYDPVEYHTTESESIQIATLVISTYAPSIGLGVAVGTYALSTTGADVLSSTGRGIDVPAAGILTSGAAPVLVPSAPTIFVLPLRWYTRFKGQAPVCAVASFETIATEHSALTITPHAAATSVGYKIQIPDATLTAAGTAEAALSSVRVEVAAAALRTTTYAQTHVLEIHANTIFVDLHITGAAPYPVLRSTVVHRQVTAEVRGTAAAQLFRNKTGSVVVRCQ